MKFNTEKQGISSICDDINDGTITPHPEWQREFVWTLEEQKDLVDSINKKMPIGEITT